MLLDAFDRLPQTLCHHDAFRRNLFVRHSADGRDQTVAVDWAFVGTGTIGEEIVTLVQTSLFFLEVDLAKAPELDEIVFEGYLEGLRDAGWRGDPRMVRFGYTAASALRGVSGMGAAIPFLLDESRYGRMERELGRPIEEMMNFFAETVRLMLNLADEARELLGSL